MLLFTLYDEGTEGNRSREQTSREGQEYGGTFGQLPLTENRDDEEVTCRV